MIVSELLIGHRMTPLERLYSYADRKTKMAANTEEI